jgi:hypothetical protein
MKIDGANLDRCMYSQRSASCENFSSKSQILPLTPFFAGRHRHSLPAFARQAQLGTSVYLRRNWCQSVCRRAIGHLIPFFRMLVKRNGSRTYVGGRGKRRTLLHKVFKTLTCHLGVCSCGSRAELGMRTHRRNQAIFAMTIPFSSLDLLSSANTAAEDVGIRRGSLISLWNYGLAVKDGDPVHGTQYHLWAGLWSMRR